MVDIFVEGRKLDVFEGLDFSFNYSIADIREPDKRSTEYTKTIKCPATQNNDELFGHIYDFNIGNNHNTGLANLNANFNPNKKASVDVSQDGVRIMKGSIQLRRIVKKKTDYVYEVVFVGQLINIFSVLGDKTINGFDSSGDHYIDFSDLDHQYTLESQEASWTTPIGEGYVYPMVDWGKSLEFTVFGERVYYVGDLNPALYVKEIIDRIFTFAGFTYTSTFFDSDFFKRLIIPLIDLRSEEGNDSPRLFKAIKVHEQSMQWKYQWNGSQGNEDYLNHLYHVPDLINTYYSKPEMVICFDDDNASFPESYDYGTQTSFGNYLIPTVFDGLQQGEYEYAWQVESANAGTYQVESMVNLKFKERYNGSLIQDKGVTNFAGTLRLVRMRDGIHTEMGSEDWSFPVGNCEVNGWGPDNFAEQSIEVGLVADVVAQEGDRYWMEIYSPNPDGGGYNQWFWHFNPELVEVGDLALGIEPSIQPFDWYECKMHVTGGYFKNTYTNAGLIEGEELYMNANLPNVTMADFILSLVKMFNLYVTPNPDKDNDLIIETYNEFHAGGTLRDWTHKLDHSKDVVVSPLALLTANEFEYTYASDGDYYNDRHQSNHGYTYGRKTVSVDNDFVQKKHTTEILFSPSPLVNDGDSNRLVPKIYDSDISEGVSPTDSNTRILYYTGLLTSTPSWKHTRLYGADETRSTYPYAGHLTHPITPAQDIHFGMSLELFYAENWNTGPISITTNNLYRTFHSAYINEITDKDSKMLTAQFYLEPLDIHKLDFRDQIVIDNSIWRINKIENFNPFKESTTKVELIKVIRKDPLPVEVNSINGSGSIGQEKYPTSTKKKMNDNYYPDIQGKVRGRSNNVSPTANNFEINGDGNEIEGGTDNIVIRGNNNIIREGVTNVTLINTNNVTVTSSGTTYLNNRGQQGADIVDGGEDEVRSSFSEVPVFTIDGGEDETQEQYSETAIYILDGGLD